VESVIVGVNNLDLAIALFRKAYGWAEPLTENQKDLASSPISREPVILAAPPTGDGWLIGWDDLERVRLPICWHARLCRRIEEI